MSGSIARLRIVANDTALRIRALRNFTSEGAPRHAGDEWLFRYSFLFLSPLHPSQTNDICNVIIIISFCKVVLILIFPVLKRQLKKQSQVLLSSLTKHSNCVQEKSAKIVTINLEVQEKSG